MVTYRAYTVKEKVKIYTYYQKHGTTATARKYKVPFSTLVAWRHKATKGTGPLSARLTRKIKKHTVCEEAVALVKKLHAKHPDWSLEMLRKKVGHIQHISRTTVWKAVNGK